MLVVVAVAVPQASADLALIMQAMAAQPPLAQPRPQILGQVVEVEVQALAAEQSLHVHKLAKLAATADLD
jgi:hypothetical protein